MNKNTITYEEAIAQNLSSSFVRTLARTLERLSKDCFRRIHDDDYEPRFSAGPKETSRTLTEAGKVNSENSYSLRTLAVRLKKEGK